MNQYNSLLSSYLSEEQIEQLTTSQEFQEFNLCPQDPFYFNPNPFEFSTEKALSMAIISQNNTFYVIPSNIQNLSQILKQFSHLSPSFQQLQKASTDLLSQNFILPSFPDIDFDNLQVFKERILILQNVQIPVLKIESNLTTFTKTSIQLYKQQISSLGDSYKECSQKLSSAMQLLKSIVHNSEIQQTQILAQELLIQDIADWKNFELAAVLLPKNHPQQLYNTLLQLPIPTSTQQSIFIAYYITRIAEFLSNFSLQNTSSDSLQTVKNCEELLKITTFTQYISKLINDYEVCQKLVSAARENSLQVDFLSQELLELTINTQDLMRFAAMNVQLIENEKIPLLSIFQHKRIILALEKFDELVKEIVKNDESDASDCVSSYIKLSKLQILTLRRPQLQVIFQAKIGKIAKQIEQCKGRQSSKVDISQIEKFSGSQELSAFLKYYQQPDTIMAFQGCFTARVVDFLIFCKYAQNRLQVVEKMVKTETQDEQLKKSITIMQNHYCSPERAFQLFFPHKSLVLLLSSSEIFTKTEKTVQMNSCEIVNQYFESVEFMRNSVVKGTISGNLSDYLMPTSVQIVQNLYEQISKTSCLLGQFTADLIFLKSQIDDFATQILTFRGKKHFLQPIFDISNNIFKELLNLPFSGTQSGNLISISHVQDKTANQLGFHQIFLDFQSLDKWVFEIEGQQFGYEKMVRIICQKLSSIQGLALEFSFQSSQLQRNLSILDSLVVQVFSASLGQLGDIYSEGCIILEKMFQEQASLNYYNQVFYQLLLVKLYYLLKCLQVQYQDKESDSLDQNMMKSARMDQYEEYLPVLQQCAQQQVQNHLQQFSRKFDVQLLINQGQIQLQPSSMDILSSLQKLYHSLIFQVLNISILENYDEDQKQSGSTFMSYFFGQDNFKFQIQQDVNSQLICLSQLSCQLINRVSSYIQIQTNFSQIIQTSVQNEILQYCDDDALKLSDLLELTFQLKSQISDQENSSQQISLITVSCNQSYQNNIINLYDRFIYQIETKFLNTQEPIIERIIDGLNKNIQDIKQYDGLYIKNILISKNECNKIQEIFQHTENCHQFIQQNLQQVTLYQTIITTLSLPKVSEKINLMLKLYKKLEDLHAQVSQLLYSSGNITFLNQQFKQEEENLSSQLQQIFKSWNLIQQETDFGIFCDFQSIIQRTDNLSTLSKDLQNKIQLILPTLRTFHQIQNQEGELVIDKQNHQLSSVINDIQIFKDSTLNQLQKYFQNVKNLTQNDLKSYTTDNIISLIDMFANFQLENASQFIVYQITTLQIHKYLKIVQDILPLFDSNLMSIQLWDELFQLLKVKIIKNCSLYYFISALYQISQNNDTSYMSAIDLILQKSHGHHQIKKYLQEISEQWESLLFQYCETSQLPLIINWDQIIGIIQQDSISLQGLQNNAYYKDFQKEITQWEENIDRLAQIVQLWQLSQKHFVYLNSIIGCNTSIISSHLSQSFQNYVDAKDLFIQLLKQHQYNNKILDTLQVSSLLVNLQHINQQFDNILSSLNDFLEQQRILTPQLYFISDQDLLDMITTSSNSQYDLLQTHWHKLFHGIYLIEINDKDEVISFSSYEGEKVLFYQSFKFQQNENLIIHKIINEINNQVILTLKQLFFNTVKLLSIYFKTQKIDDQLYDIIEQSPIQIICLTFSAIISYLIFDNFKEIKIKTLYNFLVVLLKIFTEYQFKKSFIKQILISELQYYIQLVQQYDGKISLIDDHINLKHTFEYDQSNSPFLLQDQIFDEQKIKLFIQIGYQKHQYGFNYQGSSQRIVQTQLTSYAYYISSIALSQKIGCAPIGQAGTGKTETVKQFASQLGQNIAVFNTSSSFSIKSVSRILLGAVGSGYIICFDEFNRLDKDVLSAVSGYIEDIILNSKQNQKFLHIDNQKIQISYSFAIFLTMNPNYIGRNELPENLKSLMSNIIMNQPDLNEITKVMLRSFGFKNADYLSILIIQLFNYCFQQLSQQNHYDWGLRQIKSVIITAGQVFSGDEQYAIEFSIQNIIEPKLIVDDIAQFQLIFEKVFHKKYVQLKDSTFANIVQIQHDKKLYCGDIIQVKAQQIFQSLKFSSGVMLIGSTATGKTSAFSLFLASYNVLLESQYKIDGQFTQKVKINSKQFQNNEEIFGNLNQYTLEWVDGIYTKIIRQAIQENSNSTNPKHIFIVFDTNLSSDWIESLNSVLDDNKTLSLPNGERLQIPYFIHHIFECDNIANITPATVSRCAIIWFSYQVPANDQLYRFIINLKHQVLKDYNSISFDQSLDIISKYIFTNKILQFMKVYNLNTIEQLIFKFQEHSTGNKQIMGHQFQSNITLFLALLQSYFQDFVIYKEKQNLSTSSQNIEMSLTASDITQIAYQQQVLEKIGLQLDILEKFIQNKFIYSILVGFSQQFDTDNKVLFSKQIQKHFNINSFQFDNILQYHPVIDKDWEYNFIQEDKLYIGSDNQLSTIIPTIDTDTYTMYIRQLLFTNKFIIFCGPAGSGKSMLLENAIKELTLVQYFAFSFSQTTQPNMLIKQLLIQCKQVEKQNHIVLMPKNPYNKFVILIDELNLPDMDIYRSQKIIELLRLLTDDSLFYYQLQQYRLENIIFVSSCNPPEDQNRHQISPRLLSNTCIIQYGYPQTESLLKIYGAFIFKLLNDTQLQDSSDIIATIMIQFYNFMIKQYTITVQQHYIFSPRDLTRWYIGLSNFLSELTNFDSIQFLNLLYYEGNRIFIDKIVDERDKLLIQKQLQIIIISKFAIMQEQKFNFVFTYFLNNTFAQISATSLYSIIQKQYKLYFQETKSRDPYQKALYLTDQHLLLILKLDRILRQQLGHCIISSQPGYGKYELCKFVSQNLQMDFIELLTHSNYSQQEFEEFLRDLIIKSGIHNKKIVLFIKQSCNLSLSFIELTNSILASGDFYGLFSGETLTHLITLAREQSFTSSLHVQSTDFNIISQIIQNVKNNLHFVYSFDTNLSKMSPAILNRCTILYEGNWSINSYNEIAQFALKQKLGFDIVKVHISQFSELQSKIIQSSTKQKVSSLFTQIHTILAEQYQFSPRQFMQSLLVFCMKINSYELGIKEKFDHTSAGLQILEETQQQISQLKQILHQQQDQIFMKKNLADKKLQLTIEKKEKVQSRQNDLSKILDRISAKQHEIENKKLPIKSQLESVQPALEKAKTYIKGINKAQLDELKSLSKPSITIKLAMEAVILIISEKQDQEDLSWNNIRILMKKDDFMQKLLKYDPLQHVLSDKLIKKLKNNYLDNPTISTDIVMRSSRAAGPMYSWVVSVYNFLQIAISFKPLLLEIQKIEKEAEKIQLEVDAYQKDLEKLQLDQQQYQEDYKDLLNSLSQLENKKEETIQKFNKAQELVSSFESEKIRWQQQKYKLDNDMENIIGNLIIISFAVVYCVQFEQETRQEQMQIIKQQLTLNQIVFNKDINCIDEIYQFQDQRKQWIKQYEFPDDIVSQFNFSSIFTLCTQPNILNIYVAPLIFINISDIKDIHIKFNCLLLNDAVITSQTSTDYINQIERSVRFGKTLIIKDIVQYDSLFSLLIQQQIRFSNSQKSLKIETINIINKPIEVNNNFRLILCISELKTFPCQVLQKCQILNFKQTVLSQTKQYQQLILSQDKQQMKIERDNIIEQQDQLTAKLLSIEKKLLKVISESSSTQLLESETLVQTLRQTKLEFQSVQDQKIQADQLLLDTNKFLDIYQVSSLFLSNLYNMLQNLQRVMPNFYVQKDIFDQIISKSAINIFSQDISQQSKLQTFIQLVYQQLYLVLKSQLSNKEKITFSIFFIQFIQTSQQYLEIFQIDITDYQLTNVKESQQQQSLVNQIINQQDLKITPNQAYQTFIYMKAHRPFSIFQSLDFMMNSIFKFTFTQELQFLQIYNQFKQLNKPFLLSSIGQISPDQLISTNFKSMLKYQIGAANCTAELIMNAKNDLLIQNIHLADQETQLQMLFAAQESKQLIIFTTNSSYELNHQLICCCIQFSIENSPDFNKSYLENLQYLEDNLKSKSQVLKLVSSLHSCLCIRQNYIPIGLSKSYGFGTFELNQIMVQLSDYNLETHQNVDFEFLKNLIIKSVYLNKIDNPTDIIIIQAIAAKILNKSNIDSQQIPFIRFNFQNQKISGTGLVKQAESYIQLNNINDAFSTCSQLFNSQNLQKSSILTKSQLLRQQQKFDAGILDFTGSFDPRKTILQFKSNLKLKLGENLNFTFKKNSIRVLGVGMLFCGVQDEILTTNESFEVCGIELFAYVSGEEVSEGLPIYGSQSRGNAEFVIQYAGYEEFLVQGCCGFIM